MYDIRNKSNYEFIIFIVFFEWDACNQEREQNKSVMSKYLSIDYINIYIICIAKETMDLQLSIISTMYN